MTNPEVYHPQDERTELARDIDFDTFFEHLVDAKLPLLLYGQGGAKTVHHLLQEVREGESVLSIDAKGNLYREVHVVWVDVFCSLENGDLYTLREDRQEFKDGRIKRRDDLGSSLGEKLKPGEDPQEAVSRAVAEELGITSGIEGSYFLGTEDTVHTPDTYPGLESSYHFYKYATVISEAAFKPEGYIEDQPDKTNYYVWTKVAPTN